MHQLPKIKKLEVKKFRGLNDLVIDDLSVINVFAGTNNCGKTSVLEAVKLLEAPANPGQMIRCAFQRISVSKETRRKNYINYICSMFQKAASGDDKFDYCIDLGATIDDKNISYSAKGSTDTLIDSTGDTKKTFDCFVQTAINGEHKQYHQFYYADNEDQLFSSAEEQLYQAVYFHSAVNYYKSCVKFLTDYIIVDEEKSELLSMMHAFDENIDDISIVGEDIYLHSTKTGAMPLFVYGSGLQKAVLITTAVARCKDGIILIDEIDNAIHVSALKDVLKWFFDACIKWNVQAFITTHSAEAIDAILKNAHEYHSKEDVLRIITLRKSCKTNSTIKKIRTGEEAYSDRQCFRMELRI